MLLTVVDFYWRDENMVLTEEEQSIFGEWILEMMRTSNSLNDELKAFLKQYDECLARQDDAVSIASSMEVDEGDEDDSDSNVTGDALHHN